MSVVARSRNTSVATSAESGNGHRGKIRSKGTASALEKIDSTDLDELDGEGHYKQPVDVEEELNYSSAIESPEESRRQGSVSPYRGIEESLKAAEEFQPIMELKEPLKSLALNEDGFEIMLRRLKLNVGSSKELVQYLRKRASIEEDYGRQLSKLAHNLQDAVNKETIKPGTYSRCWSSILELTDESGKSRCALSSSLLELVEDLGTTIKHTERTRKELKDNGLKLQKQIQQAENTLDRCRARYEHATYELETCIQQRKKADVASTKSFRLFDGTKSLKKLQKQEEENRQRVQQCNFQTKEQEKQTEKLKREYLNLHLPNILKTMLEVDQENDQSLTNYLSKMVLALDSTVKSDGYRLKPSKPDSAENSFQNHIKSIDDVKDLRMFIEQMSNLSMSKDTTLRSKKSLRTNQSFLPPKKSIFGVELAVLADKESRIVPEIIEKCTKAIEKHGLRSVGIYRLSGSHQRIMQLKELFERDDGVLPIEDREYLADINCITGVLKLFLTMLPNSLISNPGYEDFVAVLLSNNPIQLKITAYKHLVNKLQKYQYYTLYYLIQHLKVIVAHEKENKMNAVALGGVFAQLLFRSNSNNDVPYAEQVVENLIEFADDIFAEND